MTDPERFARLEDLFAHVWMVRTFIKHSEEAEEDDDLQDVQRTLYDTMLSLGGPSEARDCAAYLKQAKKKLRKLVEATRLFVELQPELSNHTSFRMAARSLDVAVKEIARLLSFESNSGTPNESASQYPPPNS